MRAATDAEPTEAGISSDTLTEWLTAAEAAAYAGGIGLSTIREACNRNELRHVRIGGKRRGPIRTRKEWVTEWLQRWTRGGRAL
jgi:excisionase family DNA binding protein